MNKSLTTAAVRALKPHKRRREIPDAGARGLYLVIEPTGKKSWALRYRRPNGKSAKLRLGSVSDLKVEEPKLGGSFDVEAARVLAGQMRNQIAMGKDVAARRKLDASGDKFPNAAADYIIDLRDREKNRTWWKVGRTLGLEFTEDGPSTIPGSLCERWRDKTAAEITRADLRAALQEAYKSAIPGRTARRKGASGARERDMSSALGGLFRWLASKDRAPANPMAAMERPAKWQDRDRVLDEGELRKLWQALGDEQPDRIIKVMLLTACRRGEVEGMSPEEFDGRVWTVPGRRTKSKRDHVVYLSHAALEVLPEDRSFTSKVTGKFLGKLDEKLKFEKPWRPHDIRRTIATNLQKLGVPLPVTEEVLGHGSGSRSGIVGIYQRHDYAKEKKKALEAWATRLLAIMSPNVVTLEPKRA